MNKKSKVTFSSIFIFILAVGAAVAFFGYQILKTPMGVDEQEVVFDVAPGEGVSQIAKNLKNANLIREPKVFQLYVKMKGVGSTLKVGEYALKQSMTPDQIIDVIVAGKSIARNLTVAEGLNIFDLAQIMEKNNIATKDEFFKLIRDKQFIKSLLNEDLPSLEGYLFPETYKITKFESLKSIVTQMVQRFLFVYKEVEPIAKQAGWSRNQVVTFASIVEKETGASFERPLVSSVFHNRIKKNMRLQTDPTILYGMALKLGYMPNNITKNDLITPGPYNSYTQEGLPPTPIANPGKEALLATVKPASTNYLFFVSQNNGTHIFSENLQQHNQAVQKFQINRNK